MRARLVYHTKDVEENGNILEMRIWEVPITKDKPYGFKYSLAYIKGGERVLGYDNSESKGDRKHLMGKELLYEFKTIEQLFNDFHHDIIKLREGKYED